ncbi:MAG: translation initiation factor IF-2 subunit gamma [Candidatus Diapherotrites archaeon]|nr:translation initiation factor IF-2 subunit gamma [Candidatus Diapherotrites archaeon]
MSKKEKKIAKESQNKTIQAEVNIGMIGHVDHGKTSLTYAITGKWTDTHSEEIKRGISIRLGYADAYFYKCPNCQGPEAYGTSNKCKICGSETRLLRKVSFVDAPGHETLIATMLSGAALMHGAILVIAANEKCPQPRTEEHLVALNISGTKNIVVAQNKVDLVSREEAIQNKKDIEEFLKKYGYDNVPIIPTAAPLGLNIDLLIEAIENTIKTPSLKKDAKLKMYIARSFDINKPGTNIEDLKGGVIGGSIMQGEASVGDTIEITPGLNGKKIVTKIKSIAVADGTIDKARPGGLVAFSTDLDPSIVRNDSMRGQIASAQNSLPEPTNNITLEIKPLPRFIYKINESEIKIKEILMITIGTANVLASVAKQEKKDIYHVITKNPVVAEKGDRVAISRKDETGWRLAAYGVVL